MSRKVLTPRARIDRAAAEEYSASLAQIGEGWWRQIAWAYEQGIPQAMGLSLPEWREKYYGHLKLPANGRPEAANELRESGLSVREIAAVVGVTHPTVLHDLGGKNLPGDDGNLAETHEGETESGRNLPGRLEAPPIETPPLPKKTYRVLYADPPWQYRDGLPPDYGGARFHYPSMSIDDLCALEVRAMAQENAVLFLWVTAPILPEAFTIVTAWGFQYKTFFVWDKIKHNYGHYNSVRAELLLLCTRGSCLPDCPNLFDSVQRIERTDRHSEKPEAFRTLIEDLYPDGARLELFARTSAKGWDSYPEQAPREIMRRETR